MTSASKTSIPVWKILRKPTENGATQQRITGEISELQSNMVSIEGHKERSEGLDIARAIGELNAVRTRLTINANLMKSAQEMENKLYTDFL